MDVAQFRARLEARTPVHGFWTVLSSPLVGAMAAAAGAEYVVLDLQHGEGSEAEIPGIAASVALNGAVPLVRTRSSTFADVGRPLDLGAHGIIVPSIRDAAHAREMVAATRYGPVGTRSIGRLVGVADPLLFLLIETAGSYAELDEILQLDGIDGVYVGSKDLGLSIGHDGETEYLDAVVADIVARALAADVPVGVHASTGEVAAKYAALGCTIVTAGADSAVFDDAIRSHLITARRQ